MDIVRPYHSHPRPLHSLLSSAPTQSPQLRATSSVQVSALSSPSWLPRLKLCQTLGEPESSPAPRSSHSVTPGLYGNGGCVNALAWGERGETLATAGDDTKVCIWRAGLDSDSDLSDEAGGGPRLGYGLESTWDTGHRRNIFSVKYAPHLPTRLMTASGDSEIRVFDLNHSGSGSPQRSGPHTWTHHDQSACTRVIKCHSDRVKRIATEDSPDVFLTVSEDGTVRQHDLRTTHTCRAPGQRSGPGCGPPLASYPGLTLYTLSVSAARPHLFVVAGTNPYAFLHDRRMVRTEVRRDWGVEVEAGEMTQCVRRFGLAEGTRGSRQVVSAKLSKGNGGRDLLVSYSGGRVWLFDTDAEPEEAAVEVGAGAGKEVGAKRRRSGEVKEGAKKTRRESESGDEEEEAEGDYGLVGGGPAFSTIDVEREDADGDAVRMRLVAGADGTPTIMASARRPVVTEEDSDSTDPGDFIDEVDDYAEFEEEDDDEEGDDEEEEDSEGVARGVEDGSGSGDDDDDEEEEEEEEEDEEEEAFEFSEEEELDPRSFFGTRRRTFHDSVPIVHPRRSFAGHRNVDTVKDVNFAFNESCVASGSDDGNLFLWTKEGEGQEGKLVAVLEGDDSVVNVAESHPTLPVIAVSGIDPTVKLFAPAATLALAAGANKATNPDALAKIIRDNTPGARRSSRSGLGLGAGVNPALLASLAASLGGRQVLGELAAGRGGVRVVTADGEEQECVVM